MSRRYRQASDSRVRPHDWLLCGQAVMHSNRNGMRMEEIICPLCQAKNNCCGVYRQVTATRDLVKCNVCGLYFVWPLEVASTEPNEAYTKEYYDAWALENLGDDGLAKMKQATFDRLLARVEHYQKSGKLLDIGCALGHLLASAKDRGWEAYGVEVSEYGAEEAAKRIGPNRVWQGDFLELAMPHGSYDVITNVDLIEHVYDINAFLGRCRELLKTGGLLVTVTPDIKSLSHVLMKKTWPHFNDQHVIFFSKESIEKTMTKNGYQVLEIADFRKALNFYYMRSVIRAHGRKVLIGLMELGNVLLPRHIKRMNFYIRHGEMLVIAKKK